MSTSSTPHHPVESEASPVGEHVHMPGPSLLPVLNCVGLALTIIGVTEGLEFLIGGATLFLVTTIIWIVKASREIAALPDEHH